METDSCCVSANQFVVAVKSVTHGSATAPGEVHLSTVQRNYERRPLPKVKKNMLGVETNEPFLLLLIAFHTFFIPVWLKLFYKRVKTHYKAGFFFLFFSFLRKFVKVNCFLAETMNGKLQLRMNF